MSAGQAPSPAAEKRAEFARLRDGGMSREGAMRELSISDVTAYRYERWYRSDQGLPARPAGWQGNGPDWKDLPW